MRHRIGVHRVQLCREAPGDHAKLHVQVLVGLLDLPLETLARRWSILHRLLATRSLILEVHESVITWLRSRILKGLARERLLDFRKGDLDRFERSVL